MQCMAAGLESTLCTLKMQLPPTHLQQSTRRAPKRSSTVLRNTGSSSRPINHTWEKSRLTSRTRASPTLVYGRIQGRLRPLRRSPCPRTCHPCLHGLKASRAIASSFQNCRSVLGPFRNCSRVILLPSVRRTWKTSCGVSSRNLPSLLPCISCMGRGDGRLTAILVIP